MQDVPVEDYPSHRPLALQVPVEYGRSLGTVGKARRPGVLALQRR